MLSALVHVVGTTRLCCLFFFFFFDQTRYSYVQPYMVVLGTRIRSHTRTDTIAPTPQPPQFLIESLARRAAPRLTAWA